MPIKRAHQGSHSYKKKPKTTILRQQVKSAEVRGRISEQMRIILTVYDKLTLLIEHANDTN